MHLTRIWKLGVGLAAVFAAALVVVAIGLNSDPPAATADGPTPTKIANGGSLGGVIDLLVHDGTEAVGLYYCIGKTDHQVNGTETDTTPDELKTALQCNIDLVTAPVFDGDTPPGWCALANACNATGGGADFLPGPPPPPPYTIFPPVKGYGFYYHDGDDLDGLCSGTPCSVTTTCFEGGGPADVGPNFISRAVVFNPLTANPATGTVDLWYNQSISSCKAGDPKGATAFADLPLTNWLVYDKGLNLTGEAAPYRPADTGCATGVPCVLNFDGDACTDLDELSKTSEEKCGDDPQNPDDSFFDINTVDLSGTWTMGVRLARADCTDPQDCVATAVPGAYFGCRADLQHDLSDNSLILRPYCYTDLPGIDFNPEAYPGVSGDGFSGGAPPGPQVAAYASGFPSWAYGDVDEKHSVLTGSLNKSTNMIEVAGCFADPDGGGFGTVWIVTTVSAHMNPGTVLLYAGQPADCVGSPIGDPLDPEGSLVVVVASHKGRASDADNDGVPTSRELQDDEVCGRRDPYNGNDYYDVSVPRDGVIDLTNDILGVINHYSPGGYITGTPDVDGGYPDPTTFDNFDRPPTMSNSLGGTWNRGSPDGVIDLSNDILGVILQYNPGGCAPTS